MTARKRRQTAILVVMMAALVAIAVAGYVSDTSIVIIWPVMIVVAAVGSGLYYWTGRRPAPQSTREP